MFGVLSIVIEYKHVFVILSFELFVILLYKGCF